MTDENEIEIEPAEDETPTGPKEAPSVVDREPALEEPTMTDETAVSPPSPPPTPEPAPVSQRRGCVLLFLGAILGAIMGTVLTLSILLGLNGSLTFSSTDAQLRRAINDTRIEQEDMIDDLVTRSAQLEVMATQVGSVAADQAAVNEAMSTVDAGMEDVMGAVTAVATQVTDLDERIDTTESQLEGAATAAAEFNTFLGGLRELLFAETTVTATPTTSRATLAPMATGEATPSEPATTSQPTRTPRPTKTALPQLTATSESTNEP